MAKRQKFHPDRFTGTVPDRRGSGRPDAPVRTNEPATSVLRRILFEEKTISLRELARRVEVDPTLISKALRGVGYRQLSPELVERISVALGYPPDFFPEVREAKAIARVKTEPELRDRLYDELG